MKISKKDFIRICSYADLREGELAVVCDETPFRGEIVYKIHKGQRRMIGSTNGYTGVTVCGHNAWITPAWSLCGVICDVNDFKLDVEE